MSNAIYKAVLDTRNFCFEAYGPTKEDALKSLQKGFEIHAIQMGLKPDWWTAFEDGLVIQSFEMETPYRDREVLRQKDKS